MATFISIVGVILFSIMLTWGFNATIEQTRRTLKISEWPWLDKVQVFFVIIAVLMTFSVLFFLAVGFSATGATREEVYKRDKSRYGGRFACAVAMFWCVILLTCWLLITSVCSLLCFSYFIFGSLCSVMPAYMDDNCIDFEVFAPILRKYSNANLRLCGGDMQQFCAFSSTAHSWYIVGWIGSFLVICGLAFFLALLAANYAHVGNVSRYVELRDLAFEASSSSSPSHTKQEDSFYYPRWCRGGNDERIAVNGKSSGQQPWRTHFDSSLSSTRLAEKSFDSFSQYAYRPQKQPY